VLWILAEIAIAACDLAEVLGTAIGLNLLFNLPLIWGVIATTLDTLLFLAIQNYGMRRFESFILFLITIIGACFIFEVFRSSPDWVQVASGFKPSLPPESLYVAIGIIGATVMPHNLYLHSALVQTRAYDNSLAGKRLACRYNLLDSVIALNCAFFVNSAILIVAAATFYKNNIVVTELQQAHALLAPLLGTALAGVAFAIALVCAGQASTITGTLAGQIIMEGYLHFKIRPMLRRLITRLLAVVPAAVAISTMGETATYKLLILSQVILSFQLPFAIFPLLHFTSDKNIMGDFANNGWMKTAGWTVGILISLLNVNLVIEKIKDWTQMSQEPAWIYIIVIPIVLMLALLLLYLAVKPLITKMPGEAIMPTWRKLSHFVLAEDDKLNLDVPIYKRIGAAVAHTEEDRKVLSHALPLAKQHDAVLCLFHVVEGASGTIFGSDAFDSETRDDEDYISGLAAALSHRGVEVETFLGYGNVSKELVRMVDEEKIDLLLMGGHGHRGIKDLLFGSTVAPVRHELRIPVIIVR
jgi:manganese transport protein